jgi:E3 ubiquitin-protein ligase BOI-like protein
MYTASELIGDLGCGGHQLAAAVGGCTVFSDFTCNNNNDIGPRKRARVGDVAGAGVIMDPERQHALLPPVPVPQAFAAVGDVQSSRVLGSSAASTSGRTPNGALPASQSQGLLSHLYSHGVEIDALVRIEVRRPVSSHCSVANAV